MRRFLAIVVVLLSSYPLMAEADWSKAYLNGGFETNSIHYLDEYGSNNYLKLDFGTGSFGAGFQMEGYLPPLQGYPVEMQGVSLATKYLTYNDGRFSATLGDFYEQFGSGLLFRAYEERSLGINTAIEGARVSYTKSGLFAVKGFVGVPRRFRAYNYDSRIAGLDMSFDLMALAGVDLFGLKLEGSFLNKRQALDSEWQQGLISPDINGYSARMVFDCGGLTLKGEYVARDADASRYNEFNRDKSRALLLEAAYTYSGFGANFSFRKISNAGFQSDFNGSTMFTVLNYIPSLTHQHTYSLAALNPYQAQMNGEFGGQADIYYFVPRHTPLGGKKGMKLHLNFSTYYGPSPAPQIQKYELYYRDLTLDAERWWGSSVKTSVLYSYQTYNHRVSPHPVYEFRQSHIIVADVTYKFNRTNALRMEYEHLWCSKGDGNWCAGALEYTIAPRWSFSIADMWNYGYTREHYFNGGVSYSVDKLRAALNFGRFREGYQCAGGVCRLIPAYSGINLNVTISF